MERQRSGHPHPRRPSVRTRYHRAPSRGSGGKRTLHHLARAVGPPGPKYRGQSANESHNLQTQQAGHQCLGGSAPAVGRGGSAGLHRRVVYSKGRWTWAAILPSNRMGTLIGQGDLWRGDVGPDGKGIQRSGGVGTGQRTHVLETINDAASHGVALSRGEERRALTKLAQTMATTPMVVLPQIRRLARGHAKPRLESGGDRDRGFGIAQTWPATPYGGTCPRFVAWRRRSPC
ncbi:hypothetical protein DFAR_1770005 [Desulfarculales bacterium]